MTDAASRLWYESEEYKYDYDAPPQTFEEFDAETGHFTAMVWKNTCEMGCGYSENYVVCRYKDNGNIVGQFDENVMPRME